MAYNEVNPYDLDWGMATAEGFNENGQELLLVFNIDVSSTLNIERSVVLVVGRALWFGVQASGITQKIVFDLRGQPSVLLNRARKMKSDVLQNMTYLNSEIKVIVEILI